MKYIILAMDFNKPGGYEANLTPRSEKARKTINRIVDNYLERRRANAPQDPRFKEQILSTIDLKVLTGIFLDLLTGAGVRKENANVVTNENITTVPTSPTADAGYEVERNRISWSEMSSRFKETMQLINEGKPLPDSLLFEQQRLLIHELCHAFSRNRIFAKDSSNQRSQVTNESGYSILRNVVRSSMRPEKTPNTKRLGKQFEALNEGVTERITDEVFLEYGRRVGREDDYKNHLASQYEGADKNFWTYLVLANIVDSICRKIAEHKKISKGDAWQMVKRGYFNNPTDFFMILQETYGEAFVKEYSSLDNRNASDDEYEAFEVRYGIEHPGSYAEEWLKVLGIVRPKTEE